jgi:hypothetical protein
VKYWVSVVTGQPKERRGFHFDVVRGDDGKWREDLMGFPVAVIVEEKPTRSAILYRQDARSKCVGDTWHQTVEAAKAQAAREYEGCLGPWIEVPDDEADIVAFAKRLSLPS